MKKLCRICCERKNVLAFTKNKNAEDGYNTMCRACSSEYRKFLNQLKKEEDMKRKEVIVFSENLFSVGFE